MCLLLFNSESLVRISLIVLFDYLIRLSQNVHSFSIGWESCSLNTHLLMCPDAHMHTYTHVRAHTHLGCMSVYMVPTGEGVTWWITLHHTFEKICLLSLPVGPGTMQHWKTQSHALRTSVPENLTMALAWLMDGICMQAQSFRSNHGRPRSPAGPQLHPGILLECRGST